MTLVTLKDHYLHFVLDNTDFVLDNTDIKNKQPMKNISSNSHLSR